MAAAFVTSQGGEEDDRSHEGSPSDDGISPSASLGCKSSAAMLLPVEAQYRGDFFSN